MRKSTEQFSQQACNRCLGWVQRDTSRTEISGATNFPPTCIYATCIRQTVSTANQIKINIHNKLQILGYKSIPICFRIHWHVYGRLTETQVTFRKCPLYYLSYSGQRTRCVWIYWMCSFYLAIFPALSHSAPFKRNHARCVRLLIYNCAGRVQTSRSEDILRLGKRQEAAEHCILRMFVACTLHQILLRWRDHSWKR